MLNLFLDFSIFVFLLNVCCLTNLISHCLYVVEFPKTLLEKRNLTNFGMILLLGQVSEKLISFNTFLNSKPGFSNSLTFLTMTFPYPFCKTLMVDNSLRKRRCTKTKNVIDTALGNRFES